MKETSLAVDLALALIRAIVTIYDVISFPIYFLIQKPLKRLEKKSELNSNGIWKRINCLEIKHFINDCKTVSDLFSRAVLTFGDKKCFGSRALLKEELNEKNGKVFKLLDDYNWFSYKQIDKRVESLAKGLQSLGVRPKDNVVIFAETRIEWVITAQAIFRLGAVVVTLYATLGEEALIHGINETEAEVVITTNDLLSKVLSVLKRLSRLKSVVFMEGLTRPEFKTKTRINLISFSQLENRREKKSILKEFRSEDNSTAVLMYTSGSTGVPKAVMISHKNLLHSIRAFFTIAHSLSEEDVYCAYLPLAHVLELSAELFFFSLGLSVGFASPSTLTDNSTAIKKGSKGDTSLLRPTVLCAVPLILDRIRKSIEEEVQQKSRLSRALFHFAIDYKKAWTQRGFTTPIIDLVVCRKIRSILGGRLRLLAVGSAPLAPETHQFIRTCLSVELLQGYGLTETTASATLQDINDFSVGTVGAPLDGVQLKLVDWIEGNYRVNDKPNPRGEIVLGGPSITLGYYKNEELTRESYCSEGGVEWFFTGDIGEVVSSGELRIIDRKKDLVKLQFGEYVSLGKIESLLKVCPLIDNICVYGDSYHTFLVAIVIPNAKYLQGQVEGRSIQELCCDRQVISRVTQEIRNFGQRAGLHKTEIPSKVHLVADEWIPDSGLVTAALKLRRKQIQDFYQMEINKLYAKESTKSLT